jgi:heat shock protein HtpX
MSSGNTFKTALLLTSLTVLLVLVGRLLGGTGGMVVAFGLAVVMNFGAYWFSDRMALAMTGAREVTPEQAPELHQIVDRLAARARLPKPRVFVVDAPTPNAFATGRDSAHAAVAVTTGITQLLSRDELAGVLAHELAHVRNRDTLISAVVATLAGAITMLANIAQWALIFGGFGRSEDDDGGGLGSLAGGLLMIFLAPIAATIIQLAISRTREYDADATGAAILGDPMPLARALQKLEVGNKAMPLSVNPSLAHQFTVQPITGSWLGGLFSTHPPTAERVARLQRLALEPSRLGTYDL